MKVFEVVNKLKELGEQPSPLSPSDKTEIEYLYNVVLGKTFAKTSCSDCYHDAIIEMSVYIKKNGHMKEKTNYGLKNGILLQMEFGSNEMYTNNNLTDEIAERYLAKNPKGTIYFSILPSDWQERAAKRMTSQQDYNQELLEAMVESFKDGVSDKSVADTFKDYQLNGKKVTKKILTLHINKALEIIADTDIDKDKEDTTQAEQMEEGTENN